MCPVSRWAYGLYIYSDVQMVPPKKKKIKEKKKKKKLKKKRQKRKRPREAIQWLDSYRWWKIMEEDMLQSDHEGEE